MTKKIRLFCLPFAGGNSYSYRKFQEHLADFINMIAIDLPGHGKYIRQPLLTHLEDMAAYIFQQINQKLTEPYAIYGHSMGTLLGYLVSKHIVQAKLMPPIHLFFSGHQGPPVSSKEGNWYALPKEQFITKVMAYGGIPKEIAAEKELMDLFVPIMRADFQAIANYHYKKAAPLEIPITIMFGSDEDITYDEALTWQEVTNHPVSIHQFSGGHFFIFDHLPEICSLISQTLEKAIL
jgi:surfactin synthase thioesterase subunit